ncbi:MarR family winged helix-turn-helix transcriptional regulator [Actinomycetospora termitidis]|uniref:MarR family transcriptional regulator n=1 Tax=Actinomycetospora termitidis TaxID=3053470 RepID=A0ABT7M646_9PSEU|nr:MarR family transcriptional regulator [Actinomycetospora sp. Odt1-22]MDL5156150.1 MarR family transcriptional regulator [Actinomycetospora sp. Odt1-22]
MGRREPADGSLTVALHQALSQVAQQVEQVTAQDGVGLHQWLVMRPLAAQGDLTMGDLVAGTGLNDSTLTRVVDRLATSGLVFRGVDPTDRRRVRVSLSARGRTLHDRLAPAVEVCEAALLDELGRSSLARSLAARVQ